VGSWKYIGISSVDFKKSHIYEMVAITRLFFHTCGRLFMCREEGRGGEKERKKGERKEGRKEEKHIQIQTMMDIIVVETVVACKRTRKKKNRNNNYYHSLRREVLARATWPSPFT